MSLSSKYGEARDTADTGETLYSGDTVSLSSKYRAGAEVVLQKVPSEANPKVRNLLVESGYYCFHISR